MQRVHKYKYTQLARIVATLVRFGSRKIIFSSPSFRRYCTYVKSLESIFF